MRKLPFILAVLLLLSAVAARADSLVIIRPVGTDSLDWSQLGVPGTAIPSPFSFTTAMGVAGTGSYADPGNSIGFFRQPGEVGAVMLQSTDLSLGIDMAGNFASGDILNWTENAGALTLTFAQGYNQIGAQIEADNYGAFTAQICDINGCFIEDGASNGDNDNSAIYIGIDGADITSVTFSLTSTTYDDPDNFIINQVTLGGGAPVIPEPGSLILLGTGLLGLSILVRRKAAFRQRM